MSSDSKATQSEKREIEASISQSNHPTRSGSTRRATNKPTGRTSDGVSQGISRGSPSDSHTSAINQYSALQQAVEDCRSAMVFSLLLSFVIALLGVAPILFLMNVYDRVLPSSSLVTLASLLVLVMGIYLFWSALEWLRARLMMRISLRLDWDMAGDVFQACFSKGLRQVDPNVHQVMGDLLVLRQFFTKGPVLAVVDAPFSVVFIALGYLVHPLLAFFIFLALIITLGVALFTRRVTTGAIEQANNLHTQANLLAAACVKNAETAQSMGMMPALKARWFESHTAFLQHHVNAAEANGFIGMFGGVFAKALPSLQIAFAAVLATAGQISVGAVVAASFLVSKAIAPLKMLIEKWEDVVKARMTYERLNALLTEHGKASSRMSLPAPVGHIVAKNLSINSPDDRPLLDGLTFRIEPGEVLALIGPNGVGKSSLLRALIGISRPESGSLRLDGAEVSEWDSDELGRHIGYVSQSFDLFDGTVAQNIARMGEVDPAKVVNAAKLVGIHEFLLSLPQGYDTLLAGGGGLSGGQVQRIKLARAVYGHPVLYVFDEPDSHLDEVALKELYHLLFKLREAGATVVCATHNKNILRLADLALVLGDGKQAAFGRVTAMAPQGEADDAN